MKLSTWKGRTSVAAVAILSMAFSLSIGRPVVAQAAGAIGVDPTQAFLLDSGGMDIENAEAAAAPVEAASPFMNFGGGSAGAMNALAEFDSPTDGEADKFSSKPIRPAGKFLSKGIRRAKTSGAARAVEFALAQVGKPYIAYTAGPDSYDCSGLTMAAWKQGGVTLRHYSLFQYYDTEHVRRDELQPGDLMFFKRDGEEISHVAIYYKDDLIIEAPGPGKSVTISNWKAKREKPFFKARRPVTRPIAGG